MMRDWKPIIVCAVAMLMVGCQGLNGIPPDVWEAKHLTKKDAIVIHGVKAVGAEYKQMTTIWQRLVQRKNRDNPKDVFDISFYNLATDNLFRNTIGKMNYVVTKLEAGEYVLGAVRVVKAFDPNKLFGRLGPFVNVAGAFYDRPSGKSGLLEHVLLGHVSAKMDYTLAFTVKPGEVIYIGDFFVDASTFPLKSIRIENNFQSAQALPNLHPSFRTKLMFRMPRELVTSD